jgi:hypothetical protein
MKNLIFSLLALSTLSCGIYNFTGGSTGDAKTFQVNFFRNDAPIVEPGLDRDFTIALQDLINNQTNLSLTDRNADLLYEGEIVEFNITPMTATAEQRAAQNRVTISVNVRFTNRTEEKKDFEKRFSFYYDYPAAAQFNSVKGEAIPQIFERITQDIFNASLADW